jgi:GNAT superfamily N-acetyltransferase
MNPDIQLRAGGDLPRAKVLALYRANAWSSADQPDALMNHLRQSHSVVSAWENDRLLGLGNVLSDGQLVAYYSHLLVLPDCQNRGLGTRIARRLMERYRDFHQQVLLADGGALRFYERLGFKPAGNTRSMWIFQGDEH